MAGESNMEKIGTSVTEQQQKRVNGAAKEHTHMTHGQGQPCGDRLREWGWLGKRGQRGKIGQW